MENIDTHELQFDKNETVILPFVEEKDGIRRYEIRLSNENLETGEKDRLTITIESWQMTEEERRLAEIRKIFFGVKLKIGPTPDNS